MSVIALGPPQDALLPDVPLDVLPADALRAEIGATLRDAILVDGLTRLALDRSVPILMRKLRPYLRNRYSVQHVGIDEDVASGQLKVVAIDHAEGGRPVRFDNLVINYVATR